MKNTYLNRKTWIKDGMDSMCNVRVFVWENSLFLRLSHVLWTYTFRQSLFILVIIDPVHHSTSLHTLFRFFVAFRTASVDWKIDLTILTDFNRCRYNSTVGVTLSRSRICACILYIIRFTVSATILNSQSVRLKQSITMRKLFIHTNTKKRQSQNEKHRV